MRVGLVGLGNLGTPVGLNLLKASYPLTVYDLDSLAVEKLVAEGANGATSSQEVAELSDVVITILPSPQAVVEVVESENGLLGGFQQGKVWIDSSTNDMNEIQRLAKRCLQQGIDVLEVPLTGGIPRAYAGTMTAFVGGEQAVYEKYLSLLQVYAGEIHYLGTVGSASIAKLITNMLAFIHLWALGEGLMLGKRCGLDVGTLFEAIKLSCGNSFVAETEGPEILNGSYDYGFTLDLASKDAHLVYELARMAGVPLENGRSGRTNFCNALA